MKNVWYFSAVLLSKDMLQAPPFEVHIHCNTRMVLVAPKES